MKNKETLLFIVVFFLLSFSFVFAFYWKPEIKYPIISGLQIKEGMDISSYILYIFNIAIIIGVLIAIFSLMYGGFLYVTSADNPHKIKEGKSIISSGILGLLILLGSHLILSFINPSLTVLKEMKNETIDTEGIKLTYDNGKSFKIIKKSIPSIPELLGENAQVNKIEILSNWKGKVKVRTYSQENYQGSWAEYEDNSETTSFQSIKIIPFGPGVYLYTQPKNARKASVYDKPYLFPSPSNPDDDFEPWRALIAPWSYNLEISYSTTALPTEVILYERPDCTGNKIVITTSTSSTKDVSSDSYKCAKIKNYKIFSNYPSPGTTTYCGANPKCCYFNVIIYAKEEFQGTSTNYYNVNRNILTIPKVSNPNPTNPGNYYDIKSVKIILKTPEGEQNGIACSERLFCPEKIDKGADEDRIRSSQLKVEAQKSPLVVNLFKNVNEPPKCVIFKKRVPEEVGFFDVWFLENEPAFDDSEATYVTQSRPDLREDYPELYKGAIAIKIKNTPNNEKLNNLGAILFEEPFYKGSFKIFITENKNYWHPSNIDNNTPIPLMNWLAPKPFWKSYDELIGSINILGYPNYNPEGESNIIPLKDSSGNDIKDRWGQVRRVSSILIFNVDPNQKYKFGLFENPFPPNINNINKIHQELSGIFSLSDEQCSQNKKYCYIPYSIKEYCSDTQSTLKKNKCSRQIMSYRKSGNIIMVLTEKDPLDLYDSYPGERSAVFLEDDVNFKDNPIGNCPKKGPFGIPIFGTISCVSGFGVIPYNAIY